MKIGKKYFDNTSLLLGVAIAMVGLSVPQTQSIFAQVLNAVRGVIAPIFGGKK